MWARIPLYFCLLRPLRKPGRVRLTNWNGRSAVVHPLNKINNPSTCPFQLGSQFRLINGTRLFYLFFRGSKYARSWTREPPGEITRAWPLVVQMFWRSNFKINANCLEACNRRPPRLIWFNSSCSDRRKWTTTRPSRANTQHVGFRLLWGFGLKPTKLLSYQKVIYSLKYTSHFSSVCCESNSSQFELFSKFQCNDKAVSKQNIKQYLTPQQKVARP